MIGGDRSSVKALAVVGSEMFAGCYRGYACLASMDWPQFTSPSRRSLGEGGIRATESHSGRSFRIRKERS